MITGFYKPLFEKRNKKGKKPIQYLLLLDALGNCKKPRSAGKMEIKSDLRKAHKSGN